MPESYPVAQLKPGREKSVRNRHPWVFSGAIGRVRGAPQPGGIVELLDSSGDFLARGYHNPRSQIAVRLLSWDAAEEINAEWWRQRLQTSLARRAALAASGESEAYRLVHAESDGLPGLIVDRYGDWLVLQSLTLGIEPWKSTLTGLLMELLKPRGIYERSDADVRAQESLPPATGPLAGDAPPQELIIHENGLRFQVDVLHGHKTGFYLDQRENRRKVAPYCAGREVLNAFSYTGAFAVYAARQGAARITNLDSSAGALRVAAHNLRLNGLERDGDQYIEGDAFQVLRRFRDQDTQFDVIILDPPKFAFSRAQLVAATRGYKDINLLGMRLLRPGGILCTFSCSGLVSEDLFQKVLFGASLDAGREVRILERLGQGGDHPVLLTFPESAYLKGFICRVE
jgi:23S rRNA (cytosine1962-C5)-methyltransferase